MSRVRPRGSVWLLCWSVACGYPEPSRELASPSARQFELEVYPVLLRDCGFAACHGTTDRFYRVYGPGRERLAPDMDVLAPATNDELDFSFERARSMLAMRGAWKKSLLLRKPLAEGAGGASHGGEDPWRQNVYASRDAAGYQVLARWARSMADAPGEGAQ